jgi:hypothetical protein
MMKIKQIAALMAFSLFLTAACTSPQPEPDIALSFKMDAANTIASKGYTGILLGEFSMEGCSSNDSFGMLFSAKNWLGHEVERVVCGQNRIVDGKSQFVWRVERK